LKGLGFPQVFVLNLLLVATIDALDPGMSIRMTIFSMVSLLVMFLTRYFNNWRDTTELKVWHI